MKLSDYLLADTALGDLIQSRRLDELESSATAGFIVQTESEAALRTALQRQGEQIRSLAGALTVVSATVDLLGEIIVERSVVDEAEFYDRLIDVVTAAQTHQEAAEAKEKVDTTTVTCVWCGKSCLKSESVQVPTGFACAPCNQRHGSG